MSLIEWVPVGPAGRARLTVHDPATGEVADIDTLDLGRAADRATWAVRITAMLPGVALADVERELLAIAEDRLGTRPEAPELLTLTAALDRWQAHEDTPRVVTGFRPLDELTDGGLPHGTMSVIAGPPGAGKSALCLQLAIGAMLHDPELRAVWGLGEMTPEAIACRAVAAGSVLAGLDPVPMSRAGRRVAAAVAVADELRRDIGDRLVMVTPLTPDRIAAAVEATGARLLAVDYLQLVRANGAADRRGEVDAVVRALRELAIARGLVVLAVSNIGRGVTPDSKAGGIGKESGEIDFAADLLLLGDPADEADEHGARPVTWRCRKHRHGSMRDIEAMFDGALQVFTPPAVARFAEFDDFAAGGRA